MRKEYRAGALLLTLLGIEPVIATPFQIESGAVEGVSTNGMTVFKGIPYAAPPLEGLRWKEPQPAVRWKGVRIADKFAPACMQSGVSMPGEQPPAMSEDCLYLNIWTPSRTAEARWPILFWIHGGGYSNGSASMPLYWGDQFTKKGILVVTIAYRLGPLGFLAHPELTRDSPHHSSGNYGLMDQIAALKWIQRNIAVFGGDPHRVIIAGQSAGSMAVSELMSSRSAKGLFHGAIGESGAFFEPLQLGPQYLLANAERDGEKYLASLHVNSIAQLRRLPAAELLGGTASAITHPIIDNYVLPLSPYDAFKQGQQNDVPLLVGSNAEEARAFSDTSNTTAATFENDVERSVGRLPQAIVEAYPRKTDIEARQARLDLERDLRFGWDMWAWARLQANTGHSDVYYYYFERQPPFPASSPYAGWGASHFAELWYVFNHLDQQSWAWQSSDRKLAADISNYWANFVRSGNPNGRGLVSWPAFTDKNTKVQYLEEPITTGDIPNIEKLRTIDAVYSSLRSGSAVAK